MFGNGKPDLAEILPRLQRHQVIVHTKDDRSLKGLLVEVWSDAAVLRHASYLAAGEDGEVVEQQLKGDTIVERANISFWQKA